eukprot:TRINITY_DN1039_c0_g1_i10.p2 TRINITY_DN1039_c0_g1~~TRINITY_DN1039_c0_g1_i10.p2  ORF type:complete len:261 (+),score=66.85 TRINITY_DN1039_c0_g1_i10:95-877(+)
MCDDDDDCEIGRFPITMTLSGFLALAGLTGVIVYSKNVASLKDFEGDKGQCKIMAVHREESCKGHDKKKSSGASKKAAKGSYTFDYDVAVLSPEVCPNTTIRYDHTQGSIWCDKEPDHPLNEELACWYEHDCSKVWFEDPDSLLGRKMVWLVVSIVGMVLCGLIHAAHWCLCCGLCAFCCAFFLDRKEDTDSSVDKDTELPPPIAGDSKTNSSDIDIGYPQPAPPPHLAGLEWKNVSPQVGEMTPVSVPPYANKMWEEEV